MKRRQATICFLLILACTAAFILLGCSSSDDPFPGANGGGNNPAWLFTANAISGSLEPFYGVANVIGLGTDTFILKLEGVQPYVVMVSDRPERKMEKISVEEFVANWMDGAYGFRANPPNAALEIMAGNEDADVVILEISDPSYEDGVLTFSAWPVNDTVAGFAGREDDIQGMPEDFDHAGLFIDSGFSPVPDGGEESWLFLLNSETETLTREVEEGDGVYRLTMGGVYPYTLKFTERPVRKVEKIPTDQFVANWLGGAYGFKHNPPNAALDILAADPDGDVAGLELAYIWMEGADLNFLATPLEGESVEGFEGRADPFDNIPMQAEDAALFIDSISEAEAVDTVEVNLVNNSGQTIYMTVMNANVSKQWLQFSGDPLTGQWVTTYTDTPDKTCTIDISKLESTGDNAYKFTMPALPGGGGRIYWSANDKIDSFPTEPGMDSDVLYDKSEWGWMGVWNMTSVDFFGIPLSLELDGQGANKVGWNDGVTRETIMTALAGMPAPYPDPFPGSGTILRYLSPLKNTSGDIQTALDNEITKFLDHWKNPPDTYFCTYGGAVFEITGINGTEVTMQISNWNNGEWSGPATLSEITSVNVFGNTIAYDCENGGAGARAGVLVGATLNRGAGTLDLSSLKGSGEDTCCDADKAEPFWYVASDDNAGEFNMYAKTLRSLALNERIYAQSNSDICQMGSSITQFQDTTKITYTFIPFE